MDGASHGRGGLAESPRAAADDDRLCAISWHARWTDLKLTLSKAHSGREEPNLPTDTEALQTAIPYAVVVSIAYLCGALGRPVVDLVFGPSAGVEYYRAWIFASTTALVYSRGLPGQAVKRAVQTIIGGVLATVIGYVMLEYSSSLMPLLFVLLLAVAFVVQCLPGIFGTPIEVVDAMSLALMTIILVGFSITDPAGRVRAIASIMLGTLAGLLLAFSVGAILFPRNGTNTFLKAHRAALDRLHSQACIALRPLSSGWDSATDGDGGSPTRLPISHAIEVADLGSASRYGLDKVEMNLLGFPQEVSRCMPYLQSAQNECFVPVGRTGHLLVPVWPCHCNSIPYQDFARALVAARKVASQVVRLSSVASNGLETGLLSNLEKHGHAVSRLHVIARLAGESMAELARAAPRRIEPGHVRIPSDEHIKALKKEIRQLLDVESAERDKFHDAVTGQRLERQKSLQASHGGGRRPLLKVDETIVWYTLLGALQQLTDNLSFLHFSVTAALSGLPWFRRSSLSEDAMLGLEKLKADMSDSLSNLEADAQSALRATSKLIGESRHKVAKAAEMASTYLFLQQNKPKPKSSLSADGQKPPTSTQSHIVSMPEVPSKEDTESAAVERNSSGGFGQLRDPQ